MNMSKLFVRSLPFTIGDNELTEIFSKIGNVKSAKVIVDRDTGRSKGYGFVEMGSDAEAETAIRELNNSSHEGRTIEVSIAKDRASTDRNSNYGKPRNFDDRRRSY